MKKANTLSDFINVFNPSPLDDEEFYENLDSVRNSEIKKLERFCLSFMNPCTRILFSGCRGSGKTTEMCRLASSPEILQKFEVIKIDLVDVLDVSALDYVDVVFEIMSSIILHFSENYLQEPEIIDFLDSLYFYLQSVLLQSDSNTPACLSNLVQIIVKLRNVLKFTDTARDELRDKLHLSTDKLLLYTDIALQGIRRVMRQKQFLIIVDGFDQADSRCVKQIFSSVLNSIFTLDVCIVFVLPNYLAVLSDLRFAVDAHFSLGLINPLDQNRQLAINSIGLLKHLVLQRADEQFFEKGTLHLLVKKSGGILKDLFYLIVESSLNAMVMHPEIQRIKIEDVCNSCMKLRMEYFRSIRSKEHYDCMKAIYYDPYYVIDSKILTDLLRDNLILEHGCDKRKFLHPLVVDFISSNKS